MYEYKTIQKYTLIYLPYKYYLPLTSFPIKQLSYMGREFSGIAPSLEQSVVCLLNWYCKESAGHPILPPSGITAKLSAPPKINNLNNKRKLPTHVGDTSIPEFPQSFPCHCFSQADRLKLLIRTTPRRVALLAMIFCHWEKANEPCCGASSIEMSFSAFTPQAYAEQKKPYTTVNSYSHFFPFPTQFFLAILPISNMVYFFFSFILFIAYFPMFYYSIHFISVRIPLGLFCSYIPSA